MTDDADQLLETLTTMLDDPSPQIRANAIEAMGVTPNRLESHLPQALRDDNVRRISEELDDAWVTLVGEVIADGVDAGVFRCADPVATSWRLCALLDGLGIQVVLHHSTMSRSQMYEHVRRAAALELAYEMPG